MCGIHVALTSSKESNTPGKQKRASCSSSFSSQILFTSWSTSTSLNLRDAAEYWEYWDEG